MFSWFQEPLKTQYFQTEIKNIYIYISIKKKYSNHHSASFWEAEYSELRKPIILFIPNRNIYIQKKKDIIKNFKKWLNSTGRSIRMKYLFLEK